MSEEERGFASPPCSLAEVDPAYSRLLDLKAWRKAERERIIAARMALRAVERAQMDARISERLEQLIGDPSGLVVSGYWPFRAEQDLRPLLARLAKRGARTALPVVIAKGQPLEFRVWQAGDPIERGVWNIPIPSKDAEVVVPDVTIAPVVGFDPGGYRLGYGGGFFDRTLAALLPHRPRLLGVGYELQAIPTIHPQAWDIPMDAVVTEARAARPEKA
ncbi:MAG: 5-formyltetrahydrofolate cyclo-ligase [Candidatus Andeanibacterium colombiense]|uniref:5-formyltetrahydrofolate cyclo-ligase n=1 Tax=Candidatus Andeanibacterium colombiense TaxID=3121345 RepID=A0AAJ5X8V7_9SPHN|nr:MAG: 5-formyltetrahydrofolate cyclo-ligase [Sphingomonadaceae bacterium]